MYQSGRQTSTLVQIATIRVIWLKLNRQKVSKRGEPNLEKLGDGKYLSYPYNPSIVVARGISWRRERRECEFASVIV